MEGGRGVEEEGEVWQERKVWREEKCEMEGRDAVIGESELWWVEDQELHLSCTDCALVPSNIILSNFYLHRQYWLEGDFPVKAIDKGSISVSLCSIP